MAQSSPNRLRCYLVPALNGVMASAHFSDKEYGNLWSSLSSGQETHVCTRQVGRGSGQGRAGLPPMPPGALPSLARGAGAVCSPRCLFLLTRAAVRVQAGGWMGAAVVGPLSSLPLRPDGLQPTCLSLPSEELSKPTSPPPPPYPTCPNLLVAR